MEEAIRVDGDKYMWDGSVYETRAEANTQAETYAADGFETQIVQSDVGFVVYTRRVVTEIVVEGETPI